MRRPPSKLTIVSVLLVSAFILGCRSGTTPTPQTPEAAVAPTAASLSTPSSTPPRPAASTPPQVKLPKDDAAHVSDIEWWYFNGHLIADDSSRYGFHYVVFKVGASDVYFLLGQLAVTDQQRKAFSFDQRFGGFGQQPPNGFEARTGEWQMAGFDGQFRLIGQASHYAFDVVTTNQKPPVGHGAGGLVDFQFAGTSAYYSYTRLQLTGTLTDGAIPKRVSGIGWMDHQWGDLQTERVGWDWFAIQLDDGADIMFSVVRDHDRRTFLRYGTYISADGHIEPLAGADVAIESLSEWRSPITGLRYPSGWRLEIPRILAKLELAPVVLDAEFHTFDRNTPPYWEGEVAISGMKDGKPISGEGFVELVGYDE